MTKNLVLADVVFEEVPGVGLLVQQSNRQYLARGWSLTDTVEHVIRTLFRHGFTCLIRFDRQGARAVHPRGQEADYLGFSRTPEERWLLVLDQFSGRPDITQVTIEKSHHEVLLAAGLPVQWENSGGKNLFLPIRFLEAFLDAIDEEEALRNPPVYGTPESAAWFRAKLAELELSHVEVCRILLRHGDDRAKATIERHLRRMANGQARVSGEMRALLGMIAQGRAKAAKRRMRLAAEDLARNEMLVALEAYTERFGPHGLPQVAGLPPQVLAAATQQLWTAVEDGVPLAGDALRRAAGLDPPAPESDA